MSEGDESLKATSGEGSAFSTSVQEYVKKSCNRDESTSDPDQGQLSTAEKGISLSLPKDNRRISDHGYASQASLIGLGEGGGGHFHQMSSSDSSSSVDSYHTASSSPTSSDHVHPMFPVPGKSDIQKYIDKIENLDKRVGVLEEDKKKQQQILEIRPRADTDSKPAKIARINRKRQEFKKWMSLQLTKLPNKECDQKIIMWLAQTVIKWKFIGRALGLEDNELSRIEAEHPKDVREQCYQMFKHWRSVDSENYTYIVLGDVLKDESFELFSEYVKKVHELSE